MACLCASWPLGHAGCSPQRGEVQQDEQHDCRADQCRGVAAGRYVDVRQEVDGGTDTDTARTGGAVDFLSLSLC